MFPAPKHFSDDRILFVATFFHIKVGSYENEIFSISGHTNLQTCFWNLDHPKSMLKTDHFGGSKMEKKKVLGWKNRMKKYFLLKLFLNCFGHWKVSFLTFFNFFRPFVSVLGPKVEKMLVFCSKINEISNRSIHVGMSRNRKNLNFWFF